MGLESYLSVIKCDTQALSLKNQWLATQAKTGQGQLIAQKKTA